MYPEPKNHCHIIFLHQSWSMKVLTRTGDDGTTSDCSGKRLPKSDFLFDIIGSIYELNSVLGLAGYYTKSDSDSGQITGRIQNQLFVMGSNFSGYEKTCRTANDIAEQDKNIDELEGGLATLNEFILQGGCHTASSLHVARSVTRRLERRLTDFFSDKPDLTIIRQYTKRDTVILDIPWQK